MGKLWVLPDQFVDRWVRLLEGPFDLKHRPDLIDELMRFEAEIKNLAHQD